MELLSQTALPCREKQVVAPFFSGGLWPVETDTGEFYVSGRRIGLNHDLPNGTLALWRRVEQTWLQDRLPHFRIRACSGLVRFEIGTVCGFLPTNSLKRLLFVNS